VKRNNTISHLQILGKPSLKIKSSLHKLAQTINRIFLRTVKDSKLRAVQIELQQSETQLQSIFENSAIGFILMDTEGYIIELNNITSYYTGLAFGKPLNKKDNLITSLPDYRRKDNEMYFERVLKGEKVQYESIYFPDDGSTLWFNINIHPVINRAGKVNGICLSLENISERKKIEKNLRETDQRLTRHLHNTPLAVIEWDKNFIIQKWSVQSENIFGWNESEVLNKHFQELNLVFEEDTDTVVGIAEDLMSGRVNNNRIINRNNTKTGDIIYCQWFNSVLKDEKGDVNSILSFILNITAQKNAEEKLIQLSQAVEQSPASVVITDTRGNIEYVNKKFTTITGYSLREVLGKNPSILKSGVTSNEEYRNLWEKLTSGLTWKGELHNKKKNGELFWEFAAISPIHNEKNEIINFLAVKEDITERKKGEEELLNSRKQFQNLVENISGIYWVTDLDVNRTIYVSPSFENISGRKAADFFTDQSIFIKTIHNEDKAQVVESYKNIGDTNKLSLSYRIVKPSGETRWVSAKSTIIKGHNGHKMEYGYAEDITEKKQAEEALKESEETFRRLFDESADPVLLLDERGFVDCNQSAISILGYASKHDVLHKKPWEISPEKQPDGILSVDKAKAMIAKAFECGHNRFEWIHTNRTGTDFPVEVMLTPILLQGKQSYYTVWRDITERKRAEEEIVDKHMQLRLLSEHLQNIREEERKHIAREIHDELGQQLTVLMMDAAWLDKKISKNETALKEKTQELLDTISETIKTVRRISTELRPSGLDDLGLESAMTLHLKEFEKRSGIIAVLTTSLEKIIISEKAKTALFRIFQESLTNIARHSKAKNVKVDLQLKDNKISLVISDDGIGYDEEKAGRKNTLGLLGMKERAAAINGEYIITGKAGKGTTISLMLPLTAPKMKVGVSK
jgi:PAS domain S-box-containing protein